MSLIDEEKLIAINPQDVTNEINSRKSKIQKVKERLLNLMILVTIVLLLCMTIELSDTVYKLEKFITQSNFLNSGELIDIAEIINESNDQTDYDFQMIATNIRQENMIDDVEINKPELKRTLVQDDDLEDLERMEELRIYDDTNDHPDWNQVKAELEKENGGGVNLNW